MTNSLASAEKPKAPAKTLVVGSSGHAHVTCVPWTELKSVNVKDFDAIVFNVVPLDDETIKRLPVYGFFDKVRGELSLFLRSGGTIIAITPPRRGVRQKDGWRHNWEWSPIDIATPEEAGDTIDIKRAGFQRYLSKLKRWTFFFYIPQTALTYELTNVFGSPHQVRYSLPSESYAVNRYGRMLAGEVPLLVTDSDGHGSKYGNIILLPFIPELEEKEAVNLVLEDLIGKPQQSLPPDWIEQIQMPFVDAIDAEIAENSAAIDSLMGKIAASQHERAEIEKWKKLVYATGHELEQIFEEAVTRLGAKTRPASAEEEFVFVHEGSAGVVECKGVTKSISLDHVRQTDSHVLKFNETENSEGKGVLFGNAWRTLPLSERGKSDTPIFPDNVVRHAAQRGIALVGAAEFLGVFCRFLKGEVSGEVILDTIMTQSGIVDFRGIK